MNPAGVVPEFDAVTLDEFTQPARKRAR